MGRGGFTPRGPVGIRSGPVFGGMPQSGVRFGGGLHQSLSETANLLPASGDRFLGFVNHFSVRADFVMGFSFRHSPRGSSDTMVILATMAIPASIPIIPIRHSVPIQPTTIPRDIPYRMT